MKEEVLDMLNRIGKEDLILLIMTGFTVENVQGLYEHTDHVHIEGWNGQSWNIKLCKR